MDPRKNLNRKTTIQYTKDHILDVIDIKSYVNKNKQIPKTSDEFFIYHLNPYSSRGRNSQTTKDLLVNLNEILVHIDNKSDKMIPLSTFYEKFMYIGSGAFGTVFSAIDKKTKEKVALKVTKVKDK